MPRISLFVALVAGSMMAVGCGMQPGQQSARGGLAVVDLDYVAKAIGRTQDINDALKTRQAAYEQALQKGVGDLKKQLDDKKKELGETPTPDDQATLSGMERQAANALVNARSQAQRELENYRQQKVAEFRNEIKPWAQQIASEKGLSVVIPKNEGFLLSVDPGVDITADVIKLLQTKKPAPAPTAAAPAAPLAPVKPSKPATTAEAPSNEATR